MAAEIKKFVSKHLPAVIVWFGQTPIDMSDGWCEQPGAARIVACKSVCMSDGSSRRYYKIEASKKLQQKKNSTRGKRVSKK
jgi:hypothetical protein